MKTTLIALMALMLCGCDVKLKFAPPDAPKLKNYSGPVKYVEADTDGTWGPVPSAYPMTPIIAPGSYRPEPDGTVTDVTHLVDGRCIGADANGTYTSIECAPQDDPKWNGPRTGAPGSSEPACTHGDGWCNGQYIVRSVRPRR